MESTLSVFNTTSEPDVMTNLTTAAPSAFSRFSTLTLGVVITLANGFSIILLGRSRESTHAATRYGFISLGLSDVCVGLTIVTMRSWYGDSAARQMFCRFEMVLNLASQFNSCVNLFLLSLERCIAVTKPVEFNIWVTKRRKLAVLIIVWVCSLVICTPIFYDDGKPIVVCVVVVYGGKPLTIFWVFLTVVSYSGIFVCYFITVSRLRSRRRQIANTTSNGFNSNLTSSRDSKSITTIAVLVALAGIGYVPLAGTSVWLLITGQLGTYPAPLQICISLLLVNAVLNPFVYVWQIKHIRPSRCCRSDN